MQPLHNPRLAYGKFGPNLIDAYLGGKMSPDERQSFLARLRQDPALAAALRAEKVLREALQLRHDEQIKSIFQQNRTHLFQEQKPSVRLSFWRQYSRLAAAASLALLVAATYFIAIPLLTKNDESQVFKQNYTRLEYSGDLSAGNDEAESQAMNRAFKAYKSKDFPRAIQEASTLNQSDRFGDWANLLLGACYLEQNNGSEAIAALQKVKRSALSLYSRAQWNIAMVYLKNKQQKEATEQLQRIANDPDNVFASKAKALRLSK